MIFNDFRWFSMIFADFQWFSVIVIDLYWFSLIFSAMENHWNLSWVRIVRVQGSSSGCLAPSHPLWGESNELPLENHWNLSWVRIVSLQGRLVHRFLAPASTPVGRIQWISHRKSLTSVMNLNRQGARLVERLLAPPLPPCGTSNLMNFLWKITEICYKAIRRPFGHEA